MGQAEGLTSNGYLRCRGLSMSGWEEAGGGEAQVLFAGVGEALVLFESWFARLEEV